MSNVVLAGFGTFVTFLALGAFSVFQLDRTNATTLDPVADPDADTKR